MCAAAMTEESDNVVDNAVIEQLQAQVSDLKSSLSVMHALMQNDIEMGNIRTVTPTRSEVMATAYKLSRYDYR